MCWHSRRQQPLAVPAPDLGMAAIAPAEGASRGAVNEQEDRHPQTPGTDRGPPSRAAHRGGQCRADPVAAARSVPVDHCRGRRRGDRAGVGDGRRRRRAVDVSARRRRRCGSRVHSPADLVHVLDRQRVGSTARGARGHEAGRSPGPGRTRRRLRRHARGPERTGTRARRRLGAVDCASRPRPHGTSPPAAIATATPGSRRPLVPCVRGPLTVRLRVAKIREAFAAGTLPLGGGPCTRR